VIPACPEDAGRSGRIGDNRIRQISRKTVFRKISKKQLIYQGICVRINGVI